MTKIEAYKGKRSEIKIEKVIDIDSPEKEKPLLISGFTGVGMIGTIIANELIKQFDMEQIGYVLCEDLPPITVFYEGEIKHPFRIYYDEKRKILVTLCEVPFPNEAYNELARTLVNWAIQTDISEIVTFQGMASKALIRQNDTPVFAAGQDKSLKKLFENGVEKPPKGIITGAEAAILNETLNKKMKGIIFLTAANPRIPAPEASADILEKFGEIYHYNISLEDLKEQSDKIKNQLQELQEKTNDMHQNQQNKPKHKLYS